jgi:hypothetical protein
MDRYDRRLRELTARVEELANRLDSQRASGGGGRSATAKAATGKAATRKAGSKKA